MTATSLGRVNVATPGTLVHLSSDPANRAAKIFFQAVPGLTGKGYIGMSGLNRSTLQGVLCVLAPNASSGISDSFFLESADGADTLNLSEYFLDMDVAGEGLLISLWKE